MEQVRKRDIKLSDYNISRAKYNELKYFCMQYEEKKRAITRGLNAVVNDGMPHGTSLGDPTQNQAVKNARLEADIELIEQTAIEAAPDAYSYIIKNVSEGTAYEYMNVPCGRRQFYEARRLFFYLLAQKK